MLFVFCGVWDRCSLGLFSKLFNKKENAQDQNGRKYRGEKQSRFQVSAHGIRNGSNHRRADRRAKVSCQCKKRKHCSAVPCFARRGIRPRLKAQSRSRENNTQLFSDTLAPLRCPWLLT